MWAVPKTGGFNPIKILLVICSHYNGLKSPPSQKEEEEEKNRNATSMFVIFSPSIKEHFRQIFVAQVEKLVSFCSAAAAHKLL